MFSEFSSKNTDFRAAVFSFSDTSNPALLPSLKTCLIYLIIIIFWFGVRNRTEKNVFRKGIFFGGT